MGSIESRVSGTDFAHAERDGSQSFYISEYAMIKTSNSPIVQLAAATRVGLLGPGRGCSSPRNCGEEPGRAARAGG